MRLPKTLLWIGALLTASSAIRCGGDVAEGGPTAGSSVIDAAAQTIPPDGENEASHPDPTSPSETGDFAGGGPGGGGRRGDGGSIDGGRMFLRDGAPREGPGRDAQALPGPGDAGDGCPTAIPNSTDTCATSAVCPYFGDVGKVCTCPRLRDEPSTWMCFNAPVTPDASTCPPSLPHDQDACTLQGLPCRYGRQQCFCGGRRHDGAADDAVWNCW